MRSSRIERVRDEFVSAKTSSGLSKELQTGAFILNLHLILHPFFKLYNPSEQLINRGTWRPLLPLGLTQKNTQRACVCLGSAHTERKRCVTNSRLASSGPSSNRERQQYKYVYISTYTYRKGALGLLWKDDAPYWARSSWEWTHKFVEVLVR